LRKENKAGLLRGFAGLMITLLSSFALALLLILVLSGTPGKTMYFFLAGPFTKSYYFGNMLNQAVPLILTGLGASLAFNASVFNLGGEGQAYAGALTATVACLALPGFNGFFGAVLSMAAAGTAGACMAGLSGFFRMKWNTDELISSFLISSALSLMINYFITGPLDDPENNLLATRAIGEQFRLLRMYPPSRLNTGLFIALGFAVLAHFFLNRTHRGYELRMCGINRDFARYGGINVQAYLFIPMALSGGFHGLAGAVSVLGTHYRALKGATAGMGWNGIAVALIARNNPLAVLPAALFFAYLDAGAKAAMLHSDVTFEIAAIAQSVIFYLVTAQSLYDLFRRRKRSCA